MEKTISTNRVLQCTGRNPEVVFCKVTKSIHFLLLIQFRGVSGDGGGVGGIEPIPTAIG